MLRTTEYDLMDVLAFDRKLDYSSGKKSGNSLSLVFRHNSVLLKKIETN